MKIGPISLDEVLLLDDHIVLHQWMRAAKLFREAKEVAETASPRGKRKAKWLQQGKSTQG